MSEDPGSKTRPSKADDSVPDDTALLVEELEASRARIVSAGDAARRRLERDLHDGAQQRLVLLRLKLSMAERLVEDDPAARGLIDELRSDLDDALRDLRELAHGIYPSVLESDGLPAALEQAVQSAALPAQLALGNVGRYRPEVEVAVYFCCLEALQNAAKHAGEDTRASIRLGERGQALEFEIADDGAGFNVAGARDSAGLQNMADRLGAVAGHLTIESGPGQGTKVKGVVSLAAARRASRLPRRLASVTTRSLVGRRAELSVLHTAWGDARRGEPRLVLISGEPGIGKTRLAAALAELAAQDGARVLLGECQPDPELVYQPWAAALGRDVGGRSAVTLQHLTGGSGELTRMVPELRERVPDLPAPTRDDPEGQRGRLFAAVARYLSAAAEEQPLLIVLEDLHWADRPTLDLLRYLANRLEERPLLFVATFRQRDVDGPLAELITDLQREEPTAMLTVNGLDVADVEAMVRDRLDLDPPPGLAAALRQHTDGNAFFLEEVLRDLAGQADLSAASVSGVPVTVQATIARTLSQLRDSTREHLIIAAIIGRQFEVELVAHVAQACLDEMLESLQEAINRGLVGELPGQPGLYSFAHALVREVLQNEPGATRVARLHRLVGEALERRHRDDPQPPHAEMARHFLACGDVAVAERAATHADAAGHNALARLGYAQAAEYFNQALEALERTGASDREWQGRLLVARGDAMTRAGRMLAGRASFMAALANGRKSRNGHLVAQAARGIAGGWLTSGTFPDPDLVEALSLADELLGDEHRRLRTHLRGRWAAEVRNGISLAERDRLSQEALDQARAGTDPHALAEALIARHFVLLGRPEARARLGLSDELVESARRTGDRETLVHGLLRRHSELKELGERTAADAALEAYEAVAEEVGQPFFIYSAALTRAANTLSTDTAGKAQAKLERALELFATVETTPVLGESAQAVAGVHLMATGQHEAVLAVVEQALPLAQDAAWRAGYAWNLAECGREDDAARELEAVRDQGYGKAGEPTAVITHAMAAWAAFRLCAAHHAPELRRRLEPFDGLWIELHFGGQHIGPVALFLGLLASLEERRADAELHMRESISTARRYGSVYFEIVSTAYLAEVSARAEGWMAAERHLTGARRLADDTGYEAVVERSARAIDATR